jgi:hypothetical protein
MGADVATVVIGGTIDVGTLGGPLSRSVASAPLSRNDDLWFRSRSHKLRHLPTG